MRFSGAKGLDFAQRLQETARQLASALQDGGEGFEIRVVIGARARERIIRGQEMGEAFEEFPE